MIDSLDDTLAVWQVVRQIGESILVAGLLVDLFVIVFLHDSRKLEKRGSIFGTIVITLGVMVENIAGGYGDEIVRKMRAPGTSAPFDAFAAAHSWCRKTERRPVQLPASPPPFRWRQRKIRRHRPPRAAPRRAAADAVQSLGPARTSPRAVYHKPRRRR